MISKLVSPAPNPHYVLGQYFCLLKPHIDIPQILQTLYIKFYVWLHQLQDKKKSFFFFPVNHWTNIYYDSLRSQSLFQTPGVNVTFKCQVEKELQGLICPLPPSSQIQLQSEHWSHTDWGQFASSHVFGHTDYVLCTKVMPLTQVRVTVCFAISSHNQQVSKA